MKDLYNIPLVLLRVHLLSETLLSVMNYMVFFKSAVARLKHPYNIPRGTSSCAVISVQHLSKIHRINSSL